MAKRGNRYKSMKDFQPRCFHNKAGEVFVTRPHYAHFNETHNSVRAKVLMVLYDHKYNKRQGVGLAVGDLAAAAGVGYDYLKSRLGKWCSWGFCARRLYERNGRPVFVYSLGVPRGTEFVEVLLPREWREYYVAEIQAVRAAAEAAVVIKGAATGGGSHVWRQH